jgi:hypothetical protein
MKASGYFIGDATTYGLSIALKSDAETSAASKIWKILGGPLGGNLRLKNPFLINRIARSAQVFSKFFQTFLWPF